MKRIVILLLGTLAALSCTTAQLDVPQSLASSSDVVSVNRKTFMQSKKPLSFGNYTVTQFHDAKKTRVRSASITPIYVPDLPNQPLAREATTKQTLAFTVNDAGSPRWNVVCQSRSDENGLESAGRSVELPGRFRGETVCAIDSALDDASEWTFNFSQYRPGIVRTRIKGELTNGSTTYDLMPIYKVVGANGRRSMDAPYPLGFTIERGDEPIVAIDSVSAGRAMAKVHFARDLDDTQRSLMAAASAALLLQQEDRGGVTIGR